MHIAREPRTRLWVGPVVSLALVALAGVIANLIGEVP